MKKVSDYIKACRIGEWQALKDNGFKSKHKIHKSIKNYTRKKKHKNNE